MFPADPTLDLLRQTSVVSTGADLQRNGTAAPTSDSVALASREFRTAEHPAELRAASIPVSPGLTGPVAKILNRMNEGLQNGKFDLIELNKAASTLHRVATANTADDENMNGLKSLFSISDGPESPPVDQIQNLVDGLIDMNNGNEPSTDLISEAHKNLFQDQPGYDDGTPGQALVQSIFDIVAKKQETTINIQAYATQFKAMKAFLEVLKDI